MVTIVYNYYMYYLWAICMEKLSELNSETSFEEVGAFALALFTKANNDLTLESSGADQVLPKTISMLADELSIEDVALGCPTKFQRYHAWLNNAAEQAPTTGEEAYALTNLFIAIEALHQGGDNLKALEHLQEIKLNNACEKRLLEIHDRLKNDDVTALEKESLTEEQNEIEALLVILNPLDPNDTTSAKEKVERFNQEINTHNLSKGFLEIINPIRTFEESYSDLIILQGIINAYHKHLTDTPPPKRAAQRIRYNNRRQALEDMNKAINNYFKSKTFVKVKGGKMTPENALKNNIQKCMDTLSNNKPSSKEMSRFQRLRLFVAKYLPRLAKNRPTDFSSEKQKSFQQRLEQAKEGIRTETSSEPDEGDTHETSFGPN